MMTVKLYDPFQDVLSLRDAMNQLFAQSFVRSGWAGNAPSTFSAPVDVFETGQGYQVRVLVPGLKPEDIELTVQENSLTIKGQLHPYQGQEQQGQWLVQEIGSGSFERTLTFPKLIASDRIETHYEYGVLLIWIPISEASLPKRIAIGGTPSKEIPTTASSQNEKELAGAGAH